MLENKIIILIVIVSFQPWCKCLSTVPKGEYDKNLQVETFNGVLQGKPIISEWNNVSFYGFFGIPYAQPPVGDLRFRAPQPPLNWTGILDARTERSKCLQFSEGSENCLFINVYTLQAEKQQRRKRLLPVMVWIHGGGFVTGSSDFNMWGPDLLIEQNVVVAALNYRLGVFGFFSTGDMASPGNYGLKDQIQALKWIQKNIQHFGGNPSQITIFGESAGAVSVHYLLQTPLAKGLFHKAISESGSTLCKWALTREPRKIAFRIAELLGITTNNTEELVNKLKSIEFEELDSAGNVVSVEELQNFYDDGFPLSPCIEPEHKDAVVTKGSYTLLSSNQFNKVPLLTGFNSQESGLLIDSMDMVRPLLAVKDATPATIVHKSMNISGNSTKTKVGLTIRSFYFGKTLAATIPADDILNFFSDDMFVRPIHKTVKLHSQSVPVYFYRFSYDPPVSVFGERAFKGVSHGEELLYIFYTRINTTFVADSSMSSKMVKLWTNFAKGGNPTPIPEKLFNDVNWPVANKGNDLIYLDINDRLTINVNPRKNAMKFWEDLFQKYPSVDGIY